MFDPKLGVSLITLAEEPAETVLRAAAASAVATLHISVYDGVDEKHLLPGKGVLDWAEFMRALAGIGYSGPFNYESKIDGDTVEERIAGLEENFAWMRSLGGRS